MFDPLGKAVSSFAQGKDFLGVNKRLPMRIGGGCFGARVRRFLDGRKVGVPTGLSLVVQNNIEEILILYYLR